MPDLAVDTPALDRMPSAGSNSNPTGQRYRAAFISDVHLGTRDSKADLLLEFLDWLSCDTLYLVGDMFDGLKLQRSWAWPESHDRVVQEILAKAHSGTRVVYIPGNHDRYMRSHGNIRLGGIEVLQEAIHVSADGKRWLVTHGDVFDTAHLPTGMLVDAFIEALMMINATWNQVRSWRGSPYDPLARRIKHRIKSRVPALRDFERRAINCARNLGVDGVICGHTHMPEIVDEGPIRYINDGDWTDSCTAVVEEPDGHLRLLDWTSVRSQVRSQIATTSTWGVPGNWSTGVTLRTT